MFNILRYFGFVLVFAITGLQAQVPQKFTFAKTPEDAGFSAERLKKLDALEQSLVEQGIAPNAATMIIRHGKIVHYKAFGYRNIEKKIPLQKDDIFRIASQTKLFTTISVLMLFEEGKFYLDEPISKFIPAFKNPQVLEKVDEQDPSKYTTRPAKSEITIRQLLSHTSGIPYFHQLEKLEEFNIPYFCSTKPDVLKDVVDKIAKRPLIADPGTSFTYGLNSDILGRLVEILSGMPLDEYFKTKIIEPLGLKNTYFYLPDSKASRLVELYSKAKIDEPLKICETEEYRIYPISGAKKYFSGGAGLVSTIEDYAKICQLILNKGEFNGVRLLSKSTVEMIGRNQIGNNFVWDRNDKFGLGLQIIGEESHYGDNSTPNSLTWGGMYCSEYTIDPKEDMIILVFTNATPYAHYSEVVRKFRIMAYQALIGD